jgi:membrane fusion protein (multidrug efflux system)
MTTMTEELELEERAVSEPREAAQGEKRETKRRGRSKARWLAAGALVAAAAAAGAYFNFAGRVSTDDAQVDAHSAPIAPKIPGSISEVLVEDNQMVKAGQVLVRIDPRDYQAKADQARAALAMAESDSVGAHENVPLTNETTLSAVSSAEGRLAAAEADYEKAKTDSARSSTSELSYAQADVDSKRATWERARADLARMKPLAAKAEISKQQFDFYAATARVAESDLKAAEENLANAQKEAASSKAVELSALASVEAARADLEQAKANRQKVGISSAQASTAAASIEQARANLEAAELQLSYTTLVAPIDGVATKKTIQIGQIVQPGETLLTVVPLKDVWVTANFKETQLAHVRAGQRAEVKVDMYGRSFEGRVDSIAGATGSTLSLLPPENATGNYVKVVQRIPVKIVLREAPAGYVFRPGMNVDATIFTK